MFLGRELQPRCELAAFAPDMIQKEEPQKALRAEKKLPIPSRLRGECAETPEEERNEGETGSH